MRLFKPLPVASILFMLVISLAMPAFSAGMKVDITASSKYTSLFTNYDPENLLDGDPETAWAEGADGLGVGEWIEIDFGGKVEPVRIGVRNGSQQKGTFEENNRVKVLRVIFEDGTEHRAELEDSEDLQYIELEALPTGSLKMIIDEVYPADLQVNQGNTCLSELLPEVRRLESAPVVAEQEDNASVNAEMDEAEDVASDATEIDETEDIVADDGVGSDSGETAESDDAEADSAPSTIDEDIPFTVDYLADPTSGILIESSTHQISLQEPYYEASNLLDGNLTSSWMEGAKGDGQGEFITLRFPGPHVIEGIGIANGCQFDDEDFKSYHRVRKATLTYSDGTVQEISLKDGKGFQYIECEPVPTFFLTLTIDDVYKGDASLWRRACLSELRVFIIPEDQYIRSLNAKQLENLEQSPEGRAVRLVKDFYIKLVNLEDDFPDVYAEALRRDEAFSFEMFRETQRMRNLFDAFRSAVVDLENLRVYPVALNDSTATVEVSGNYTIFIADRFEIIEENTTFSLISEDGEWKIMGMDSVEP